MFEDFNWISAAIGAISTAVIAISGFLIKWGRISQRVSDQAEKQIRQNGLIDVQQRKDSDLDKEIASIKTRNESRDSLWRRNNDEHVDFNARICALEKGIAALPGQMSEMIDRKLDTWRRYMIRDMKTTINEIDAEKMKRSRRATNETKDEDE